MFLSVLKKLLNLMKIYNEDNDDGYFLELDIQYPVELHNVDNDLPFLLERMNIEKHMVNLHNQTKYIRHERNQI